MLADIVGPSLRGPPASPRPPAPGPATKPITRPVAQRATTRSRRRPDQERGGPPPNSTLQAPSLTNTNAPGGLHARSCPDKNIPCLGQQVCPWPCPRNGGT